MPFSRTLYRSSVLVMLLYAAVVTPAWAQARGAVGGAVRAKDGSPLRGAEIVVEGTDRSTLTSVDGTFALLRIAVGQYNLTARSIGYAPVTRTIEIQADRMTRVEIELSESAVELGAITVLGTRRYGSSTSSAGLKMDAPVLDIPQSLVVISEDFMQDQDATQLDDLLRNVAGLATFSDYQDFTARGFRQGEDEVTYNGTRSNPVNFFGSPNLYNVERVEVLKGPSGVLYGALEGGALVNMVTKSPRAAQQTTLSLSGGSYDNYSGSLDATGPITRSAKLLYRFVGHYKDAESFRRFMETTNYSLAPSVTWLPAERTAITLKGEYMVDRKKGARNRGTAAPLGDLFALPVNWTSNEPTDYANSRAYTAEVNVKQGLFGSWKADLTARLSDSDYENAYHESQGFSCSINNATSAALVASCQDRGGRLLMRRQYRHQDFQWKNFGSTATVNGNLRTGPIHHRILVGGDLTWKDRLTSPNDYANGVPGGPVTSLDVFAPTYGVDPSIYVGRLPDDNPFKRDFKDWGVHASNLITIIPQVKVILGGRYNDFKVHNYNFRTNTGDHHHRTSYTRRAGAVLQPMKWASLYGSYSEGFKPQTNANEDRGGPFDPLVTEQQEVGVKLAFFEERLVVSGSQYDITKKNVLVPDPDVTRPNFLIALGEVGSKGWETDVVGMITPNWSVTANFANNDTKIIKDPRTAQLGNRFPNAPRKQGAFWTRYDIPSLHLGFAAGMTHVGERGTFDVIRLPEYTIYDGAVYFDWQRYKFQVNGKNLTNERWFAGGYNTYQLFSGAPRTIQASVRATF